MIRSKVVLGLLLMVASVSTVLAGTVSLQSMLTNVDGTTQTNDAGYNTLGWDGTTGLGTLTYTFSGAPGAHFFDVFFDHQLNLPYYNEYGATLGVVAAGQTWQIGDSFASSIYTDVQAGGALSNANSLPGTTSNFDTTCDVLSDPTCNGDFAAAMGFSFILGAGEGELITLNVSLVDPGGFRLVGTHPQDDANPSAQTIYISGSAITCIIGENCAPTPAVPEPASVVLLGSGLAILLAVSRRRFSVHR